MKTLILMTASLALVACAAENDDAEMADAGADTDMVVEETAAADGPGMAGEYKIYNAEGELEGTATNMADGTYTWTNPDGSMAEGSGTWENRDGMMCVTWVEPGETEDDNPRCWSKGEAGEDGRVVWTSDAEEPETAYVEMTEA
ncbi:hypothetical protein [Sphingomicrobium arenosum]|uniref:hypothetical protein n=1 Tax=Sphingomicrobium arenosum TaxID=2233861 RepID=UPI00224026B4|nr:hypothetical protein [Sphingomicrobium arenosum]